MVTPSNVQVALPGNGIAIVMGDIEIVIIIQTIQSIQAIDRDKPFQHGRSLRAGLHERLQIPVQMPSSRLQQLSAQRLKIA